MTNQFKIIYLKTDSLVIGAVLILLALGSAIALFFSQEMGNSYHLPRVLIVFSATLLPLGLLIIASGYKHIFGITDDNSLTEAFYFLKKLKIITIPINEISEVKLIYVWNSKNGKMRNVENKVTIVLADNSAVQDFSIEKFNFDKICRDLAFINPRIVFSKSTDSGI